MSGKRAKGAAATQHVLKPVTVRPRKGNRQQYVDVSSSDSEQQHHNPPPQSRTRIQPKESAPPPPPKPASPTKRPEPSSPAPRSLPRSKRPRTVLETYTHTVHVSRHQVEHEWILLSAPLRVHLRSEVEQVAKETLETVSAGRSARDRAMRKHLESTFARFANEFDDMMATLPVPPLPPGLPPNLLGAPNSGSKYSSSSKKKKLQRGEEDPATAAESTLAERSDVVGDGSDWSLEALEAYLGTLEKRAEQAEAAAAAAAAVTRDEEAAAASTAKTRMKIKAATKRIKKQEEEGKEEALRPAGPKGEGHQKGSRSRRKLAEEEEEEETVAEKRVRKKKQGTSRAK